ncbi:nucleotidyltransferase family protein [Gloeocapsa sp. PCC 73106]|uniref:nucleotidyltransferase family protein n=1 Tax=Gloeocapsa sp. PCC 73106 TaxID=102232 RepID=UPI00054DEBBB|nr:nucleotidyltransferase domain-containing protein [Gloeocapsa sp. PCC 73106]
MMLKRLLEEKREDIIEIAARHGAYNVRIFGSVARGEDNENSDFDFLIDYDLDKVTSWFPGGLLVDLEELLGRKVDIVTEKGLNDLIRKRILTEAIPL